MMYQFKIKSILILIFLFVLLSNCSTTFPNRNPSGEYFPKVSGESLDKKEFHIPGQFEGAQVILLIGYVQDSQFDIDRWLIGLDQRKVTTKIYELPTIQGLFPRMFQTFIDEGMRSGIPKELWGGVITIYKDGAMVQEFTGNEKPNNARVIILDKEGKVIYFHDRGFSVPALNELLKLLD